MLLRSFSVEGFKNFRQKITLDDLGPVNVIHGPNNVGKSNLLQAISFFFFLCQFNFERVDKRWEVPAQTLTERGFDRIINLEKPRLITIGADVAISPEDFERNGMAPDPLGAIVVSIQAQFQWVGTHGICNISQMTLADGTDLIKSVVDLPSMGRFFSILRVIADVYPADSMRGDIRHDRFSIAGVHRSYDTSIALALYDAKDSAEVKHVRRWQKFIEGMSSFDEILEKGTFVAIYQRKQEMAMLVRETEYARIPLQLLGSGVQQIAALLGLLAVNDSTIIGIEEPELNLRYSLQLRLRDVLQTMIGGLGGLDQIFITSHSDAFETGSHFYYMAPSPEGPRVEKRDVKLVRESLDITQSTEVSHRNAPLCYVSTEGVVRLPPRICEVIGVPKGGGVICLQTERDDKIVEIMSTDTFADRFEPKRTENDGEQGS